MRRHRRSASVAAALALAIGLFAGNTLHAQDWGWGYPPLWYPYWLGATAYRVDPVPTPPYFAVHPPVYYGQRVSMVYGDSPVTRLPAPVYSAPATPPAASAPAAEAAPAGQWIENPFVSPRGGGAEPVEEAREPNSSEARSPQMIENPYFVSRSR